jgi:hypothetical protein
MARPERYFIGPRIKNKLEGLFAENESPGKLGEGGIPLRLQTMARRGGGGSPIKIGSYNTNGMQWEKGSSFSVHEYEIQAEENGSHTLVPRFNNSVPVTVSVLNLFVTIPPNYDRVRYCAFTPINGVNVLIVAEC